MFLWPATLGYVANGLNSLTSKFYLILLTHLIITDLIIFNYSRLEQQHMPYHQARTLPNEQQTRFGSERPLSTHVTTGSSTHHNHYQMSMMNGGVSSMNTNGHVQRNLPNELVPRFGSERPASSMNQYQLGANQRFNAVNNNGSTSELLSPIKQQHQQQQQQQQNLRARQASLSELDEINYNNRQLEQHEQSQIPSNQFEDLYGKVRQPVVQTKNGINEERPPQFANAQMGVPLNANHSQYRTLPSRNGNMNNVSLNTQLTNGE